MKKSCELCGWNKSTLDKHRVIPELGYVEDNIRYLCPNCHRLVTFGAVSLLRKPKYKSYQLKEKLCQL